MAEFTWKLERRRRERCWISGSSRLMDWLNSGEKKRLKMKFPKKAAGIWDRIPPKAAGGRAGCGKSRKKGE